MEGKHTERALAITVPRDRGQSWGNICNAKRSGSESISMIVSMP